MSEIAEKYGSLQDAPQQDQDEIARLKTERLQLRNQLERIEGVPTEAGGVTGSRVNTRSAQQKAAGLNVITTNAPTVVNAPTSTSMNSQTIVPASPGRSRQVGRRTARAS